MACEKKCLQLVGSAPLSAQLATRQSQLNNQKKRSCPISEACRKLAESGEVSELKLLLAEPGGCQTWCPG